MGQQQAKIKAEVALLQALEAATPPLTAEQKDAVRKGFMQAFKL